MPWESVPNVYWYLKCNLWRLLSAEREQTPKRINGRVIHVVDTFGILRDFVR